MDAMKRLNTSGANFDLSVNLCSAPGPDVLAMQGVLTIFNPDGKITKKVNATDMIPKTVPDTLVTLQDKIIERLVELVGV